MEKIKVSSTYLDNHVKENSISEILAMYIIDKLLSYVYTEIKVKSINSLIASYCNEYTKKLISDTLTVKNLFYDIHDKTKNYSKIKYYNGQFYGDDDWSFIDQPMRPLVDRNAYTTIKVQKLKDTLKSYEEIKELKNETKSENSETNENKIKIIDLKNSKKILPKRAIKDNTIDKPQVDLNRKDLFEDDEEIINVRIAKFDEWKRLDEEFKKKIKGEKEMAEKAIEVQKKNKEYSNKLVTADSSGTLIHIKPITHDRLSNDFLISRSVINDKSINDKEIQETKEKEDKKANLRAIKNTINNKLKNNNNKDNQLKGNVLNTDKSIKNTIKGETSLTDNNEKIYESQKKDNKNIMNPGNIAPNMISTNPIQPMGSNFEYMVPDIGVTLYEGMKTKTGGKDFSGFFKKPSKYDYLNLVKERVNHKFVSKVNFEKTNENGLVTDVDQLSKISSKITNKTELLKRNEKGLFQSSFNDSISVNKNLNVSLKSIIEKLEIVPNIVDHIESNSTIYNKDIFKNAKNFFNDKFNLKDRKTIDLEEMNRFNYSIMNDQSWGNLNGNVVSRSKNKSIDLLSTKYPVKPNKKIFEKELGKNIVETKLPRERINTFAKTLRSSSNTMVNFSNGRSVLPSIYN